MTTSVDKLFENRIIDTETHVSTDEKKKEEKTTTPTRGSTDLYKEYKKQRQQFEAELAEQETKRLVLKEKLDKLSEKEAEIIEKEKKHEPYEKGEF